MKKSILFPVIAVCLVLGVCMLIVTYTIVTFLQNNGAIFNYTGGSIYESFWNQLSDVTMVGGGNINTFMWTHGWTLRNRNNIGHRFRCRNYCPNIF